MRGSSRGSSRQKDSTNAGGRRASHSGERVKVHVRVRPLLPSDMVRAGTSQNDSSGVSNGQLPLHDSSSSDPLFRPQSRGKVNVMGGSKNGEVRSFQFDAFFDENTSQEIVYEKVARPIIDGVLDGYNGTLFAYGQTGTGKTYTMMGNEEAGPSDSDDRGIIPRALDQIFETVRASAADYIYEISMSYVQLYCELLQDLLEPDFSKTLTIRQSDNSAESGSSESGVFIQGLSSFTVTSKDECLNLLRIGHESRTVAETNMNAQSSRSHAAVILNVERRPRAKLSTGADQLLSPNKATAPKKTSAKLFVVDLAGSERVRTSGATSGVRFNELKSINLSLSALGNCISALSEKKRHIPFRDSKLTRLLQDSLGGNARTALVINVSPCMADAQEALSSLSFGQRAMAVATRAHRNIEVDYKALWMNFQTTLDEKDDEIHRLEIQASKSSQQIETMLGQLADARMQAKRSEVEAAAIREEMEKQQNAVTQIKRQKIDSENDEDNHISEGVFGLTACDEAPLSPPAPSAPAPSTGLLAKLREEFEQQMKEQQEKMNTELIAVKEKAANAEGEWNRIEYDLRGEREEHLRTCIQLKECRAQLNKLDRETSDRIGELTLEIQSLKEQLAKKSEMEDADRSNEAKLKHELAQSGAVVEQVRERYRAKVENLEEFYGKKISWLVSRVNQLEESTSRSGSADDTDYYRDEGPVRRGRSRTRRPITGESDRMLEPEPDAYLGDENLRNRGNSLHKRGKRNQTVNRGQGKSYSGARQRSLSRGRDTLNAARSRKSQPSRIARKKPGVFRQRQRSNSKGRAQRSRSKEPVRGRSKSRSLTRKSQPVVDRFGGRGLSHSRSTGFGKSARDKRLANRSLKKKYGAGGSGAQAVRSLQRMQLRGMRSRAW